MTFNFKNWNAPENVYNFSNLGSTQQRDGDEREDLDLSPPLYSDLGKKVRELFNNGYYFGTVALDITTKSSANVEISTSWSDNVEKGKLHGTVEAKYHLPEYNLTLTEKMNKNCRLNTELSYKCKALKGLIISLGGAFSPRRGLRVGLVKTEWSNRYCSANTYFEIGKKFSFLTSSLVLGSRGVFGGLQWRYDVHNDKHSDFNLAMGFSNTDFTFHTCVNNGNECGGSIYHKVAPELEIGVNMKWWTKSSEPLYGIAGRYQLDRDASIKGKINNSSELGISYEQKMNDGITLTMSTFFDLRNIMYGSHKIGLGLNLHL